MPDKLDQLFPALASQLRLFEQKLKDEGLSFYLLMGYRSFEEQDKLYAQGRTEPGEIVTNAKGGQSWHNFALAADYVVNLAQGKLPLKLSWDLKNDVDHDGRSDWFEMGVIARDYGLEWGGIWAEFPDFPHVENRYGMTIEQALEYYRLGGLNEVWRHCNNVIW